MLEVHSSDELNMSPAMVAGSLRIVRSVLILWMNHGCLTRVLES